MSKIRIQKNTDNVDIEQKSVGLDCWIEGDSQNLLNTNRGLHIQIRHNGNKDTFEAANDVAKLIANAPRMLQVLRNIIGSAPITGLSLALEKNIQDAIIVVQQVGKP